MVPKIKKLKSLEDLSIIRSSLNYKGSLSDYQLNGNADKNLYNKLNTLTPYQNKLYKIALYGVGYYKPEEIKNLDDEYVQYIERKKEEAYSIINFYKHVEITFVILIHTIC